MQFRSSAAAFAAAVMLLLPAAVSAQTATPVLPVGKWTGTVTPPDGGTTPVTFDVKSSNDTITIHIDAGEHGSFPASGVAFAGTKLSFSFTPGPTVLCVLNKKDDGSFAGECTESDGSAAQITMLPPKQPGA
jgi:hypothetical protein